VKGSGPPATVVVTPPIELVGADETVPPTELEVVSRVVVVTSDVVVGLTVVVVAPVVVVDLWVVVVVPPEEVADASCPALTPASTTAVHAVATQIGADHGKCLPDDLREGLLPASVWVPRVPATY
jgi:hypothetical protein